MLLLTCRDDLEYTEGCAQAICKYYSILCREREHPPVLVSEGVLEQVSHECTGMTVPKNERSKYKMW